MSSKDLAVSVRGLSKSYTIAHNAEKHTTLGEAMLHRLKNPLQRLDKETFWALKDLDFDIEQGDVVGIIGRNGAGKSTLLKILSQITEPTKGEIKLFGRVGSLLEVGTGFHPELTGRENIFLNGAILGMRKSEIQRQFDAIVDFAEVDQFLDTPVKRYSSGMYVRLAFAVAAHLNPEILIVDEVLAVGDAQFQKKCLGKMGEVSREGGKTVLFVSHNMAAVRELCNSVILLQKGRLDSYSDTASTLAKYNSQQVEGADLTKQGINKYGLELLNITLLAEKSNIPTTSPVFCEDHELHIKINAHQLISSAGVVVRVHDINNMLVSTLCTPEEGLEPFMLNGQLNVRFSLPQLQLFPGRYVVSVFVFRPNDNEPCLAAEDVMTFEVQPSIIHGGMWPYRGEHGLVRISGDASLLPL